MRLEKLCRKGATCARVRLKEPSHIFSHMRWPFQDFYGKNVFETRYLFELNDMDLRLMVRKLYQVVRYLYPRCLLDGW